MWRCGVNSSSGVQPITSPGLQPPRHSGYHALRGHRTIQLTAGPPGGEPRLLALWGFLGHAPSDCRVKIPPHARLTRRDRWGPRTPLLEKTHRLVGCDVPAPERASRAAGGLRASSALLGPTWQRGRVSQGSRFHQSLSCSAERCSARGGQGQGPFLLSN